MPQIGDVAPNFTLPDQNGDLVSLSDYIGSKPLVVFFYPKAFSFTCTAEACAFRDSYEDFLELGVEVIGISSDLPEVQQRFAARYRLPFPMLSDRDGKVRRLWGVPKTFGIMGGRVTYVLDHTGVIQLEYTAMIQAEQHVIEALVALRQLAEESLYD